MFTMAASPTNDRILARLLKVGHGQESKAWGLLNNSNWAVSTYLDSEGVLLKPGFYNLGPSLQGLLEDE